MLKEPAVKTLMKTRRELLDLYVQKFWSLIRAKIVDKGENVQRILRLNSPDDFHFLLAARNIIEDASLAISNFQRFGLGGATKYDDLGEKYLRLYGLLSATYMQQEAILKTLKIIMVNNPQEYKDKFDKLEVRILRHKLVAHGISYHNKVADRHEAYVPLRFELRETEITYVGPTGEWNHTTVNLSEAVEAHFNLSIAIIDAIFEKSIKTMREF